MYKVYMYILYVENHISKYKRCMFNLTQIMHNLCMYIESIFNVEYLDLVLVWSKCIISAYLSQVYC